jgi:thioredoxin reductase (NADPH)
LSTEPGEVHTRVTALDGRDRIVGVTVESQNAIATTIPSRHLFMFLGAELNTDWLQQCVAFDNKRFILTGAAILPSQ